MSLLSDIAGAIVGSTPKPLAGTTPVVIEKRIRDSRARLADLRHQHATACLDALDGNATERDRLGAEIEAEERDLARLELALGAARDRAVEEARQQNTALRASRVHSATIHFRSREKAARELQEALEAVGKAWRDLLAKTDKAFASAPDPLPAGSMMTVASLKELVAKELFRVSGQPGALHRGRALPGADPHDVTNTGNPDAVEPISSVIRRVDDHAIALLRGEIAPDRTPLPRLGENGAPLVDVASPEKSNETIAEPPEVDWSSVGPFVPPDTSPRKLTVSDK